ncbi:MAG: hypothetical protein LBD11_02655 [Candidatus Peribacteria bacterium]|nr:hypothetical protein [Candidatus Peribacteria bacterium]
MLYGKFEAKQRQLNSIKIQIPLLSAYAELHEVFQKQVQSLQSHGIFLQSSLNQNGSKTTLQITSNDYELLQIFAEWYSPIEKFTQITKKEQAMQVRDQLLAFITQGNLENKAELTQLIQQSVVKILVK